VERPLGGPRADNPFVSPSGLHDKALGLK
jgi:hypothetical protein